jgi:hypothetical protein
VTVRGWLMVGASSTGNDLPPAAYCGHYVGEPPKAVSFHVGQWILWQAARAQVQLSLVCVEIPLG